VECGLPGKKRLRRSGGRRFAYRLALKLGYVDVNRMLGQISTRQFSEWRAYADLEPFDEERADLRAASIVQAIVNTSRRKGTPAFKLKDCTLLFNEGGDVPQTPERAREQTRLTLDMLMALYGPKAKKRAGR
jgi:hypothetical protein